MAVVRVRRLRKTYGEIEAVGGVSFDIAEGEVYGLLGHNGAGKSTTVEILEGHRTRTSGEIAVLGMDPATAGRKFRDRIGIVLQTSGVEPELTVREAVELYGAAYRRRRPIDEVLDLVGLEAKADARIGTLSGGQRRRLDLGLGIVGYPEVIFLDEPTTGFDPAARRRSWEMISDLCRVGTTVLLTTHYLDEAEHLADRVGVLANGRLVAEGSPSDLMSGVPESTITFGVPDGVDLRSLPIPADAVIDQRSVTIDTGRPTAVLAEIAGAAVKLGCELDALVVKRPSLEDVFLGLAGEDES